MGLSARQKLAFLSIVGVFSFITLVNVSVHLNFLPKIIFNIYVGCSLFTFILYFFDKFLAKKGWYRISENTLHLFAFIGGWPGALVAQQVLRHKTRKQPFQSLFWVLVVLNSALCAWLFADGGSAMFLEVAGSF